MLIEIKKRRVLLSLVCRRASEQAIILTLISLSTSMHVFILFGARSQDYIQEGFACKARALEEGQGTERQEAR